jgi:hypothetical protein
LSEILRYVFVAISKSLFSELSNFSGHHALLVLEEAVRSTKEAVKRDDFLKESKLRIGFVLLVRFYGFLNGGVDLGVDLGGGEGTDFGFLVDGFTGFSEGGLNQLGDFLDVGLGINGG